ncbi:MAG TPA: hypothetical protein VHP32_04185 [Ignavibacteria bacterium]|nr:hypothetical protein [Ignavibacteria bacterium]
MRAASLTFLLIVLFSCNKNDTVKIENVLDKKDSREAGSNKPDSLKEIKRITTSEAGVNIGKEVIIAGVVAQVTKRNKVSYLNFDDKYPKNTFAGVIFASKYAKFGNLSFYEKKNVELTGIISEYNKKPQIILNSPEQIKIIK